MLGALCFFTHGRQRKLQSTISPTESSGMNFLEEMHLRMSSTRSLPVHCAHTILRKFDLEHSGVQCYCVGRF
jgi:hypothetical protein